MHTQTPDNDELEKLVSEKPTFNPAHCYFIQPKKNDSNSLKVEKDITLSLDFLSRGIPGFNELPAHLKDDILSKCDTLHPVLQKAFAASIRLYHFQYIRSLGWNDKLFNLKLPQIATHLQDSYFITGSEEEKLKLRQRTEEFINQFSMGIYSIHEQNYADHALIDYEVMIATYNTLASMTMCAAYCDLHQLLDIASKKETLSATKQALNFVCKFSFPAACIDCGDLLDDILRKQEFAPGEPHQVLLELPRFEEEILFVRPRPLPAEPKPAGLATTQTPKKVSNMHVVFQHK